MINSVGLKLAAIGSHRLYILSSHRINHVDTDGPGYGHISNRYRRRLIGGPLHSLLFLRLNVVEENCVAHRFVRPELVN